MASHECATHRSFQATHKISSTANSATFFFFDQLETAACNPLRIGHRGHDKLLVAAVGGLRDGAEGKVCSIAESKNDLALGQNDLMKKNTVTRKEKMSRDAQSNNTNNTAAAATRKQAQQQRGAEQQGTQSDPTAPNGVNI